MKVTPCSLEGFTVEINRVVYDPSLTGTRDQPHAFVYFISIHNRSRFDITIKGRKWVVTEQGGGISVMEGEGVVGLFPCLKSGGHFSYNSYHLTAGSAVAEGAYLGVTEEGKAVIATIPRFELTPPLEAL